MKTKITLLVAMMALVLISCHVDPKDVVGVNQETTVPLQVNQGGEQITIVDQTWEKTYTFDLKNDPKYAPYIDKVKSIKLNGVNYIVSNFVKDDLVKGGDVEMYLGNQAAEVSHHLDFLDDYTKATLYKFNDQTKIAVAQATLDKDKILTIKARVVLDKAPTVPITIAFQFKLDLMLQITGL